MEIIYKIPAHIEIKEKPEVFEFKDRITEETYHAFEKGVQKRRGGMTILVFDSVGGEIHWGFKCGELIEKYQRAPYNRHFIGIGYNVSSMAVYLYAKCNVRYMSPEGRIMIHDVICQADHLKKKASDLLQEVKNLCLAAEQIYAAISQACSKPKNYIHGLMKEIGNANMYWNVEKAMEHGFVQYDYIPIITYEVTEKWSMRSSDPVGNLPLGMKFLFPKDWGPAESCMRALASEKKTV